MDFSRAKTVLMLVFFCLNLFLGYQLLERYQLVSPPGSLFWDPDNPEHLERLRQSLDEHNYTFKGDLPRRALQKSFLIVTPPQVQESELKKSLLGEEWHDASVEHVQQDNAEMRIFRHDKGKLTLYNTGFYRFVPSRDEATEKKEDLDEPQAKELADAFLEERGLQPQRAQHDLIEKKEEEVYLVRYHQHWSGIPVYASYLTVTVKEGRVDKVESYWLEPDGFKEEQEIKVIPAAAALIRFLEEQGVSSQERIIEEVELGYFSREYDADQWEIPPVWRVVMERGEMFFINAFTGNLEKDEAETQGDNTAEFFE